MWVSTIEYGKRLLIKDKNKKGEEGSMYFTFKPVNQDFVDIILEGGVTTRIEKHKLVNYYSPVVFRLKQIGYKSCTLSVTAPSNFKFIKVDDGTAE